MCTTENGTDFMLCIVEMVTPEGVYTLGGLDIADEEGTLMAVGGL